MKKICFIAQFPPPMHGLSKAVETLYTSELNSEFIFQKIDITDNRKFIGNIKKIITSNADLFYFTISQTKWGNLRDLLILDILSRKNKKCVIHLHGGYYRKLIENDISVWQRKMNYRAIYRLTGVIVLGKALTSIFNGMIESNRIYVVPNCVDNEFLLSYENFWKKLDATHNNPQKNVLYLSNFIRSKGYPEVLKMAKLEKEYALAGGKEIFHFDFAGKFFEKCEEEYFFNYIHENGLEEYISYHGIVNGKEKQELLKKADIFVLLTYYPNEGQPISILEAMGNGAIILTTNHAGISDIVKDGTNGIILEKDEDFKIAYRKMKKLFLGDYSQIMINNIHAAYDKYSQRNYIYKMRDIFSSSTKEEKGT